MSRSPSSVLITPEAKIDDIKSASLYDLIKLQMIGQKQMKKANGDKLKMRQSVPDRLSQFSELERHTISAAPR